MEPHLVASARLSRPHPSYWHFPTRRPFPRGNDSYLGFLALAWHLRFWKLWFSSRLPSGPGPYSPGLDCSSTRVRDRRRKSTTRYFPLRSHGFHSAVARPPRIVADVVHFVVFAVVGLGGAPGRHATLGAQLVGAADLPSDLLLARLLAHPALLVLALFHLGTETARPPAGLVHESQLPVRSISTRERFVYCEPPPCHRLRLSCALACACAAKAASVLPLRVCLGRAAIRRGPRSGNLLVLALVLTPAQKRTVLRSNA